MTPLDLQKPLVILVPLLLLAGCQKKSFDGHADGEMPVSVEVVARDGVGGLALEEVSVTFFSNRDQALLRLREAMRGKDEKDLPPTPVGVRVRTDGRGQAMVPCSFPAAFLFRESVEHVVRAEWRPEGMLQFEKPGFATVTKELSTVFTSPPYTGRNAPVPVVVEMKKEPGQSSAPKAGLAPGRGSS